MEKHRPYKTLLDIKRAHGLDPSSAIANELRQLVLIYNESYQKYAVISHTQANIITHKVKHDSFSKSLNNTILNLQALICNDCFPSSNVEHSHLATTHHTVPTTPLEKRKGSADQAILYQQYTREKRPNRFNPIKPHKKQIRKAKKGWEQLIRETLLLDLYGT